MTLDRRAWKTLVEASSEETVSTVLHDLVQISDFESVKSALDAGLAEQVPMSTAQIIRFNSILNCLELATQPDACLAHDIVEAWASKVKREHYSKALSNAAALDQQKVVRFLKEELGADPYGPSPGNCAVETVLSGKNPSVETLIALVGDDSITSMEQLPRSLTHTFTQRGQTCIVPCNILERAASLGQQKVVEWLASRIAPRFDEPYHGLFDLALTISGASSESELPTRRGIWTSIPSFGNLLALGGMPRTGLEGWKALAQVPVNSTCMTIPFDIASAATLRVTSSTVNLTPLLRRMIVEGAVAVDECDPRSGETLLHIACAGGNLDAVQMLLEMGADASTVDLDKPAAGVADDLLRARQMIHAARAHQKVHQVLDLTRPVAAAP